MAVHHQKITVGRRKTAVARVILRPGQGGITINRRELDKYFPVDTLRNQILLPFTVTETAGKYDALVTVEGGGPSGQAGAIKLGISRALVEMNGDLRAKLREHDLLTRDSRMVERKKYGQKKARKRFQFSKR